MTPIAMTPIAMTLCRLVFLVLAAGALAACGAPRALVDSKALIAEGRVDEGLALLAAAVHERPDDAQLRAAYARQRELAVARLLASADEARRAVRLDAAQAGYERVLELEPANARARDGLQQLEIARRHQGAIARALAQAERGELREAEEHLRLVLTEDAANAEARRALQRVRAKQSRIDTALPPAIKGALARPITIEFRDTPLRSVFEVVSRTAGINFAFDRDVKQDARVTVYVRNAPIEDVIRIVLATNQLERKALNENSLLIYPNTPAKTREYQELVTRSFFLVNVDAKQAQNMLRTMIKSRDVYVDERLNMVAIRDTADAVRLAERMVDLIDRPEPEVVLEVEVLEISRTRAQELGLKFPTSVWAEGALPQSTRVPPGSLDLGNLDLVATIVNPALKINLSATDTDTNLLANPRIRAKNHEKARVLIGEKLPVFTTTAVQNAGVSSSVSYIDVGLKLEVEPTIFLDDEVGIKVLLEVNSNLGEVSGVDGTTAYRIGTRSAQTNLRLRDGETQVLAGLINANERETISKLPGLGDIPGIGRVFSNNDITHDKSEIILLITPRVVRNIVTPDAATALLESGTESSVGAPPLSIGATAPRAFGLQSAGGRTAAPAAAPDAAAPAVPAPAPPAQPAIPADLRLVPALRVPEQVSLGKEFALSIELRNPGTAVEGEALVTFDGAQLQTADGGARATVKLVGPGGSDSVLAGTLLVRAVSSGTTGSATISVSSGSVKLQDGSSHNFSEGASATVRIGL